MICMNCVIIADKWSKKFDSEFCQTKLFATLLQKNQPTKETKKQLINKDFWVTSFTPTSWKSTLFIVFNIRVTSRSFSLKMETSELYVQHHLDLFPMITSAACVSSYRSLLYYSLTQCDFFPLPANWNGCQCVQGVSGCTWITQQMKLSLS